MKNTTLLLLLLMLVCAPFQIKSADSNQTIKEIQHQKKELDSLRIITQADKEKLAQEYTQILEKTNNQLSLWWNPYGLAIASLAVLFTILAIVTTVLIFRQSKEYKELIIDSLKKHRLALDSLISEKNQQLDLLITNTNQSIEDLRVKLISEKDETSRSIIEELINKLESQKEIYKPYENYYKHAGWAPMDIPENFIITSQSVVKVKIDLSKVGQTFTIYFLVQTDKGKQIWLGFAGNHKRNKPTKSINEFTVYNEYSQKEISFTENFYSIFNRGFPELFSSPISVITVRLRASNNDPEVVAFSYKFI